MLEIPESNASATTPLKRSVQQLANELADQANDMCLLQSGTFDAESLISPAPASAMESVKSTGGTSGNVEELDEDVLTPNAVIPQSPVFGGVEELYLSGQQGGSVQGHGDLLPGLASPHEPSSPAQLDDDQNDDDLAFDQGAGSVNFSLDQDAHGLDSQTLVLDSLLAASGALISPAPNRNMAKV